MSRREITWEQFEEWGNVSPPIGWMNCRAATRLLVTEDHTYYYIYTTVPGLKGETAEVWLDRDHLFIEGQVQNPGGLIQQGMYVRNVPLHEPIIHGRIDVRFDRFGRIAIRLHKAAINKRLNN